FDNPPRGPDLNWIAPTLVGEIEFENITSDRIFRQASFKGLRLDKSARSVVIEMPKSTTRAQKDAVMEIKVGKTSAATAKPAVLGIAISHPDKILWPRTKDRDAVTKLDLARYYEAAAEKILAHVAGRPISVVRAPDGIEGELFFQRHKLLGTAAPMLALKVRGEEKPYLGIDNAKSLVALGQVAVLEIHPWGSKKGDPDTPERIILDLDPAPDVPFSRVIEGAKELRQRLSALGFLPFVKTTGGKGLHVVIAVKGTPKAPLTWKDAKAFAKAVAIAMEEDSPDRYTTTISKKARPGKIFVDYLRNDRTSTGVAPWSPRARPRATIAVPVEWSQLRAGLDPQKFTIEGATPLLRRPDPWEDLAASARPLASALRRLGAG
ncbi:MAG: non-homologous end-joining DNA ligase, partial [Alphaproteobacteria bacterium]|nr:non-homologous end-joining DNA ligase [Alphaproteobacteria bacterium]